MTHFRIPSVIEIERLSERLAQGKRLDGRQIDEIREIKIETNIITKAEGSARVTIGDTQVIAGVKYEIGSPWPDTPNQGVCTVTAEFVPMASPYFEPGPPSAESIELARIVDRGIRHSEMVDYDALTIIPGEKVFVLFVDVYIINQEGNLFDASALAATAALLTTQIPKVEVINGQVKILEETQPLPITDRPIQTTYAKFKDQLLVDPSIIEESCMEARLTVSIDEKGNVVSMQKGGDAPLTIEEINTGIERAIAHSVEIRKILPK